jgi:hypothetical protein
MVRTDKLRGMTSRDRKGALLSAVVMVVAVSGFAGEATLPFGRDSLVLGLNLAADGDFDGMQ